MERPVPRLGDGIIAGVVVVVPDVVPDVLFVELLPLDPVVPFVVVLVCAHTQMPPPALTMPNAKAASRNPRNAGCKRTPP
jgi:hypothetical protein